MLSFSILYCVMMCLFMMNDSTIKYDIIQYVRVIKYDIIGYDNVIIYDII